MTLEELKKGEHETVEYKQDIPAEKEKYLKTAVAFANAAGGQIIFGVQNQTWDVIGFSDDEVFQRMDAITNSIFDACEHGKTLLSAEIRDDGRNLDPHCRRDQESRAIYDQGASA